MHACTGCTATGWQCGAVWSGAERCGAVWRGVAWHGAACACARVQVLSLADLRGSVRAVIVAGSPQQVCLRPMHRVCREEADLHRPGWL